MADTLTDDRPRVSLALASRSSRYDRDERRPSAVLQAMSKPVANVDAEKTRELAINRIGLMLARLGGWKRVPTNIFDCEWEAASMAARLEPKDLYFIALGELDAGLRARLEQMMNRYLDLLAAENMVHTFVEAWKPDDPLRLMLTPSNTLVDVCHFFAVKALVRLRKRASSPDPVTWRWPSHPEIEEEAARRYDIARQGDLFKREEEYPPPTSRQERIHRIARHQRVAEPAEVTSRQARINRIARHLLKRQGDEPRPAKAGRSWIGWLLGRCSGRAGGQAPLREARIDLVVFEDALFETVESLCRPM